MTVRLQVLLAFARHDSLPTFVGMHKRVPLHRGRPSTSDMGRALCSLRKVVPEVCVLFPALSMVVTVCDFLTSLLVVTMCDP